MVNWEPDLMARKHNGLMAQWLDTHLHRPWTTDLKLGPSYPTTQSIRLCDLLGEISDRRCTQVRAGKEGQAQKRATT